MYVSWKPLLECLAINFEYIFKEVVAMPSLNKRLGRRFTNFNITTNICFQNPYKIHFNFKICWKVNQIIYLLNHKGKPVYVVKNTK